ncbi:hypothetical protein ACOMHN_037523 [Nucella lapillus]
MERCRMGRSCRFILMLTMTMCYFLVEIIVGYVTNSVALVADSFHMLSDVVALVIGLVSIRIAKWPSRQNTFGWVRAEILGALVNAVFLVALCFSILTESIKRLFVLESIRNPYLLLAVGVGGLVINVIGLFLFHSHAHSHFHGNMKHDEENKKEEFIIGKNEENSNPEGNPMASRGSITIEYEFHASASANAKARTSHQLNMKGVFLHVLGDALGSVVVIISSLTIWLADGQWRFYLDPAMSFMLVILIFASTFPLLKESSLILLQTAPPFVNSDELQMKLSKVEGVIGVHEFHVWQLTGSRVVLSAHILCSNVLHYMKVAAIVKDLFHREGVHSTTIQPEFVELTDTESELGGCKLPCAAECQSDTCCGQRTNLPQPPQNKVSTSADALTRTCAPSWPERTSLPGTIST